MYFPYFRGKQYELILLRENSELISKSKFVPIIEPVKKNFSPLKKSLAALSKSSCEFVLIANPKFGDLQYDPEIMLTEVVDECLEDYENYSIGYIVDDSCDLDALCSFLDRHSDKKVSIIHYGYSKGKLLKDGISRFQNIVSHIFVEEYSGKLYRKHFSSFKRVLLRDGFCKRNNREHPEVEHFSDLHVTYEDENMDGFGDFLIAGDDYTETGGPAYAVAIHLTYIDDEDEDDMFIKHYVSDRTNSPVDPGGKFLEALDKLVDDLNNNEKLLATKATEEYKKLHERKHFPGLGMVKKLSMQHHVELMADYLEKED